MPLYQDIHLKNHIDNSIHILLWEIDENDTANCNKLQTLPEWLVPEKSLRQRQQLTYLHCIENLLEKHSTCNQWQIAKTETGKPFLIDNENNISVSHTKNIVGSAFSSIEIGIDIQYFSDKINKVRHKFLNNNELEFIFDNDITKLTLAWAIKEACYKLVQIKGIPLKKINIKAFDLTTKNVNITINQQKVKAEFTLYDDFCMAVAWFE